jgi:pyrroloquinoline quinone biosynthesis protein D
MAGAVTIGEASVPYLPRGVRLKFDKPRDQWVLLAPERMFVLDEIALEIVKCCDGEATVATIVDDLSTRFEAPRDAVAKDVLVLLQDFADKGVMAGE